MKILITGSDGLLGTDLIKVLKDKGYIIDATDLSTLDISSKDDVLQYVESSKPDYVVNCAAITDVNGCEDEKEDLAKSVNALAPKYLAEACKDLDVNLIHVSTDYVNGVEDEEGYTEDIEISKSMNMYGETKLEGERNIQKVFENIETPKYYILRTSWLFGDKSKNFVYKITKFAKEREFLTVVDDEIGCPTSSIYLSNQIADFIENERDSGIYHVSSSNSCSRYDFAKEILRLQNIDTEVRRVKLADFERAANISNYSILKNTKLPKHQKWEDMLKDFLETATFE